MIETSKHVDDDNIYIAASSMRYMMEVLKDYNWSFSSRHELEPFDLLMLFYKNEVDSADVGLQINNIDIISESVVTSVNDIYTEMVFQFVATDVNPIC